MYDYDEMENIKERIRIKKNHLELLRERLFLNFNQNFAVYNRSKRKNLIINFENT